MQEIKYIGFYDLPESKEKRASTLAAINKMDYICDALNRSGYDVLFVSPSWFDDSAPDAKYQHQTLLKLGERKRLVFCPSIGTNRKWTRSLKIVLSLSWLFLWLIFHVRRNEKILVYHAPWLSLPIRWAKRVKGFQVILEVEEIYGEVWSIKNILQKWEKKLLACADSYIAVSDILAEILGSKTKIIIYGSYAVSEPYVEKVNHFTINVVYAGSIDYTKGGAFNAVQCTSYLPVEYVMHICGPGGKREIKELEHQISNVNARLGREACIYHGLISDKELSTLLHTCQIAINPQFDGENMATLFPSKILKYLSHNLRVVSTRIRSIEKSKVSPFLTFSENDTPEANAYAIRSVDLAKKFDCRLIIRQLDEQFVKEIKDLMD